MTQALVITKHQKDAIVAFCEEQRPNEACGLLASKDGHVVAVIPIKNAEKSPLRYRFEGDHHFWAMYKLLPANGWELAASFHSHTRTKAYPSPTDVREAGEEVPYLIISLAEEEPVLRAFNIVKAAPRDQEGDIVEIPVDVTG